MFALGLSPIRVLFLHVTSTYASVTCVTGTFASVTCVSVTYASVTCVYVTYASVIFKTYHFQDVNTKKLVKTCFSS